MNFLDAFVDEKIRKLYLQIMAINQGNRNYINKTIEYANIRDKIRIFRIVIETKRKNKIDFSDDEKRLKEMITQIQKIKNGSR